MVFGSSMPLWQVPRCVYKQFGVSLGDEGCVCALMEEVERDDGYEMIPAPFIDPESMRYLPGKENRSIRVYKKLDVRMDLEDFFAKLQINYPKEQ